MQRRNKIPGRPGTVSLHPRVSEIRKDLVELAGNAKRFRILSEKYGPKPDAFRRYERDHLTPSVSKTIAKHAELIEETKDMDVMASLGRVAQRMELYFEAADRWLRDPDDPTRYSLSPRETEVLVIWEREVEGDNGTKTIRRKELLTDILKRCGEKGGPTTEEIRVVEINAGNPRKLFLDGVTAGKPLYELIGKAKGQIKADPVVSLQVFLGSPEWTSTQALLVEAVKDHPEAAERVALALEAVGKGGGR